MASYVELRSLFNHADLRNRVTTAVIIAAQDELDASPGTAAGRIWASKTLQGPEIEGRRALMYVLAANKDATQANIISASDAQIQTNVDAAVPNLIKADEGT